MGRRTSDICGRSGCRSRCSCCGDQSRTERRSRSSARAISRRTGIDALQGPAAWIAGAMLVGSAVLSLTLLLNAIAYDVARWRIAEAQMANGIPAMSIDAGIEWLGYHATETADLQAPAPVYRRAVHEAVGVISRMRRRVEQPARSAWAVARRRPAIHVSAIPVRRTADAALRLPIVCRRLLALGALIGRRLRSR